MARAIQDPWLPLSVEKILEKKNTNLEPDRELRTFL